MKFKASPQDLSLDNCRISSLRFTSMATPPLALLSLAIATARDKGAQPASVLQPPLSPAPLPHSPRAQGPLHTFSPLSGQQGLLALAGMTCSFFPSSPVGRQLEIHGQRRPSAMFPFNSGRAKKILWKLPKEDYNREHCQYSSRPQTLSNRPVLTLSQGPQVQNGHCGIEKTVSFNTISLSFYLEIIVDNSCAVVKNKSDPLHPWPRSPPHDSIIPNHNTISEPGYQHWFSQDTDHFTTRMPPVALLQPCPLLTCSHPSLIPSYDFCHFRNPYSA